MPSQVKIFFQLSQDDDGYPPVAVESVWATPTDGEDEYVVDNVPFFAREATLGDGVVVELKDGQRWFLAVSHPSRNSLLRVVLFEPSEKERIARSLQELGCLVEYAAAYGLLAVSVPATTLLADVYRVLEDEVQASNIDYEEPILRQ